MNRIRISTRTMLQLIRQAHYYGLESADRFQKLTPEQQQSEVKNQKKQNDLFVRNLVICSECGQETSRESVNCQNCGGDWLPF